MSDSMNDNDKIKNIFESLNSIAGFEKFCNCLDEEKKSYNTEQQQRIIKALATSEKVLKIVLMISKAQLNKDSAIESQLKIPDNFQWYYKMEQRWQKVIDRLSNYLNNTASDLHL